MKFKNFTLCALMASSFALALPATAQEGNYPTNYSETDYSSHAERYLSGIRLTPAGEVTTTIDVAPAVYSKIYYPLLDKVVTTEPGATIDVIADFVGEWMHAYVYLDYGKDGQFSYEVGNNCVAQGSDLVSFSFYSFENSADRGYNSAGQYLTGSDRSTVALSPITAPTEPGDYRMRLKIDWNNIDPAGSSKNGSNSLMTNGGAIVDFTLHVNGEVAAAANEVTNFAYTINDEKNVVFTWTNPSQDVNGGDLDDVLTVKLYKGETELHSAEATPGENAEYVYAPETYDNGQVFVIKTFYKELESAGVIATVDFPAVPKAVTNLQATPDVEAKTIDFAWTNPAQDIFDRDLDGALTVKVLCNDEEVASFDAETAGAEATHTVDPTIKEGTATYVVKVFNGDEVSAAESVEVTFPEVPRYPTNYTEGDMSEHEARYLRSVKMTPAGEETTTIDVASGARQKIYHPLLDQVVNAEPGATIEVLADYVGEWMHAYLYLDHGNDGQFSYEVGSDSAAEGSDLVSFSFYSFSSYQEDKGYNSAGKYISGDNRSTVALPNFTAPTELGDYRMRLKIDWNNIDPAGSEKTSGNPLTRNGGAIVDFILRVKEPEPAVVSAKEVTNFYYFVRQENKAILFTWTNPSEDTEGNPLTDALSVKLYKGETLLQTINAKAGATGMVQIEPESFEDGQVYTLKTFYNEVESEGVSTTVDFPVVPNEVANLSAAVDVENKGVAFTWQNPSEDIFGREMTETITVTVFYNEEELASFEETPGSEVTHTVTPKTYEGAQTYSFIVFNGIHQSAEVTVDFEFPDVAPAEIQDLTATADNDKQEVTLTWMNPAVDVLGRDLTDLVVKVYESDNLVETIATAVPGQSGSYTYKPEVYNGVLNFKVTATSNEIETEGLTASVEVQGGVSIDNVAMEGVRFDAASAMLYVSSGVASVYNAQGSLVAQYTAEDGKVSLAGLAKGVYVVRSADEAGKPVSLKIVR